MDISFDLVFRLITAMLLGALLGIERTIDRSSDVQNEAGFAGLRTYALIALMGFVCSWMGVVFGPWLMAVGFVLVGGLIVAFYFEENKKYGFSGITSEISALLIFLVGALSYLSSTAATMITVAVAMILALRQPLREFTTRISHLELMAVMKFLIVAVIMLPILPRTPLDPAGILIPYNLWLTVIFVSGVSFMGYILGKLVGPDRGVELSGLIGGIVSSTATTTSLAEMSRTGKRSHYALAIGTMGASTVMFARIAFIVWVMNREIFHYLLPPLSLWFTLSGVILVGLFFLHRQQVSKKVSPSSDLELESPFRLQPAVIFMLFLAGILVASQYAYGVFGRQGLMVVSAFSGLAELDAITLSLARMGNNAEVTIRLAAQGIMVATIANTVVKMVIAMVRGKGLYRKITALAFTILLLGGTAIAWYL